MCHVLKNVMHSYSFSRFPESRYNAMDYIPAPFVVQANMQYVSNGQICENVLHYLCSVTPTIDLMNELGAALVNWMSTQGKNLIVASQQLANINLTDLSAQNAAAVFYGVGLPIPGTGASNPLPNNCALVVTKRTALRGRSYRGRIYCIGLTEGNTTGDLVDGTYVNGVVSNYTDLLELVTTGATWTMCVVSKWQDRLPRTTAQITQVISLDADGVVDSQRRRLLGRGK